MKKITIPVFLLISIVVNAQTIDEVFKSMPADLLPGISEGNRTMLLVDSNTTTVPYSFGEIKKLEVSDDYLKIQTSEIGTTQIKLLPAEGDSLLVCVIKTVCGGVCDSDIMFFTTNWERLDDAYYLPDFIPGIFYDSSKKNEDNYKNAVSLPDIYPVSASFDAKGSDLTLKLNIAGWLTPTQLNSIEPYLKSDAVKLKWENSTFR